MIFVMALILVYVLVLIGYPFLQKRRAAEKTADLPASETDELVQRKESSYAAIQELEFDYATGKLSTEDYEELYNLYKADALHAIEAQVEGRAGQTDRLKAEIEEEIRKRRRVPAAKKAAKAASSGSKISCPKCNAANLKRAKFCSACGSQLDGVCRSCGRRVEGSMHFCPHCGAAVASAREAGR